MRVKTFRYAAPGWGVSELWLSGGTVVWHEHPRAGAPVEEEPGHPLVELLQAYFRGEPVDLGGVELDLEDATPFEQGLAAALRAVPRGETVTYGELAALAGRPRAARAAGSFCARSRHAIFLPCHRVVGADGLGSYGELGLQYKLRLLALEGWTPGGGAG